eukprot:4335035-Amphidinium_carterae.1
MGELKLLPRETIMDLANFLKCVEAVGAWPEVLRGMFYLQLPNESAKNASERRPIALLPLQATEVMVCHLALDETFDLAYMTEERNAAGQHQAGAFLVCSKRYLHVPLCSLEELPQERRGGLGWQVIAIVKVLRI